MEVITPPRYSTAQLPPKINPNQKNANIDLELHFNVRTGRSRQKSLQSTCNGPCDYKFSARTAQYEKSCDVGIAIFL